MNDAKLIEEATKVNYFDPRFRLTMKDEERLWKQSADEQFILDRIIDVYGLEKKSAYELAEMMRRMLVELATSTAREKSWHDHVLAASGGHATTPEGAAEVIRQLRGDLDAVKGENARMREIRAEQAAGRQKYGRGPDDTEHDDMHTVAEWSAFIVDHAQRASCATPIESRQELVKVAGLALSAIESFDRKAAALATGSEAGK